MQMKINWETVLSDTVVAFVSGFDSNAYVIINKKKKESLRSEHLREQFTQLHSIVSGSVL